MDNQQSRSDTRPGTSSTSIRSIESLSNALGIGSVTVYVLGLAVVAIHDSQNRIAEFSAFRTQAVCAGGYLCGLGALAGSISLKAMPTFAVLDNKHKGLVTVRAQLIDASRIAWMYSLIVFSTFGALLLLPFEKDLHWALSRWTFPCIVLPLALVSWFNARPKSIYLEFSEILAALLLAWFLFKYAPDPIFAGTLWLAAAGAEISWIRQAFKISKSPLDLNWIGGTGYFLALIAAFALWVYGAIPATLGGGAPRPVQVYFVATSPLSRSYNPKQTYLVDESPDGYYFVDTPSAHTAAFVPRSSVLEIQFQ